MVCKHNMRHILVRVLALTLVALFVVFGAQSLSHSHANGQDEAACQVCKAAHVGSAPAIVPLSVFTPLQASGYVQPFAVMFYEEFFFHDSPSRAPPTT
jgi:Protein of unknown function (DUF2946)